MVGGRTPLSLCGSVGEAKKATSCCTKKVPTRMITTHALWATAPKEHAHQRLPVKPFANWNGDKII